MSKAFECDRCGEYFSPRKMDPVTEQYTVINDIYSQERSDYQTHTRTCTFLSNSGDNILHLCPKCTTDFALFMGRNPFNFKKEYDDDQIRNSDGVRAEDGGMA